MIRSAYSLLAGLLCFAFYGCQFGDDGTTPVNGFIYNDSLMHTDYAIRKNWTGGTVIAFTDKFPAPNFSGTINAVQFLLDTLRASGDYTYMPADSVAFDKTKNFDIAILHKSLAYADGAEVNGSGQTYSKPTKASLSFYQNSSAQIFTYSIEFGKEHTISGFFMGSVTLIE